MTLFFVRPTDALAKAEDLKNLNLLDEIRDHSIDELLFASKPKIKQSSLFKKLIS